MTGRPAVQYPDKTCPHCGAVFNRRRHVGGSLETSRDYLRRTYCRQECSNAAEVRGRAAAMQEAAFAETYHQRRRHDPEYRKRHAARTAARRAHPNRQPCETCGSPDAQRHHHDYDRATDIRWLCQACHYAEHAADGTWALPQYVPESARYGRLAEAATARCIVGPSASPAPTSRRPKTRWPT